MKTKSITFYDWETIEEEICNILQIDKSSFRDYHEVVGGEYLDLWHVWLTAVYEEVHNGHIAYVHNCYFSEEEKLRLVSEYDERIITFIDAVNYLINEKIIGDENGFWVYYNW